MISYINKEIRLCLTIFLLSCCSLLSAQKTRTVEGTYVFYIPETMTLQQAKYEAMYRAQVEAIANEFGTSVSQSSLLVHNERNESFYQEGMTLVNGEWIETIGVPQYKYIISGDGIAIECFVKGKAREIVKSEVELDIKVLCNSTDVRFEKDDFVSGDKIYLSFRTPVKGYVAVFLYDDANDEVSCLLPYKHDHISAIPVDEDVTYTFFSKKDDVLHLHTQEYRLYCSDEHDTNTLYVIFSKNEFSKPLLESDDGRTVLKHLDFENFTAWFSKARVQDRDMVVSKKLISISKK